MSWRPIRPRETPPGALAPPFVALLFLLGALAARGESPAPQARPAYERPELAAAEAGRKGSYATAFDQHHPLASIETYVERFGQTPARVEEVDPARGVYDLTGEAFRVFVPESYEPNGEWGLLVWVSASDSGRAPAPAEAALRDNQLVWVGADLSGNPRLPWNRVGLALDAVHNALRYYEIDPQRVYVAGYSGGGRIATALTLLYPEVFRGGLFVYGTDFYRRIPVPDRPGTDWLPWFPPPSAETLSRLREASSLVFLTGENDFNRVQIGLVAEHYREEGFEHVTYIEIPGAGHHDWPPDRWLSQALAALER
jgi:dienelactone hydrolase